MQARKTMVLVSCVEGESFRQQRMQGSGFAISVLKIMALARSETRGDWSPY